MRGEFSVLEEIHVRENSKFTVNDKKGLQKF